MGAEYFDHLMRLQNQQVVAAENSNGEESLTSVHMPAKSNDVDERTKMAHKMGDVVHHAKKKFCVTVIQFNVIWLER